MSREAQTSAVSFRLPAAACVSLVGLGSWIVVNGLWYEIPLLIRALPEYWKLPAFLAVFIQLANIGPLLYVPLTKLCRKQRNNRLRCPFHCLEPPERFTNYAILSVGFLSCILLANVWDVVLPLPGITDSNHSVGLLLPALAAASVDCISSVTFIAYLTGMPKGYIGSLAFGEAFSDLLPSTLALIQGVGDNVLCVNKTINGTSQLVPDYSPPRFSIEAFLYCLSGILAISLIAFSLLDCLSCGLGRHVTRQFHDALQARLLEKPDFESSRDWSASEPHGSQGQVAPAAGLKRDLRIAPVVDAQPVSSDLSLPAIDDEMDAPHVVTKPTLKQLSLPIILIFYTSLINFGFLPAFQSYSSAAYSSLTFHLAVTLSGVVTAISAVVITWLVYRPRLSTPDAHMEPSSRNSTPSMSLPPVVQSKSLVGKQPQPQSNEDSAFSLITVGTSGISGSSPWSTEQKRFRAYWLLLAGLLLLPTFYVIFLATTSPNPPNLGGLGPTLVVIAWILIRTGFSALRTWLWLYMTAYCYDSMIIRITGLLSQIGAAIGAVVSFLLVVHYQLFQMKPPC